MRSIRSTPTRMSFRPVLAVSLLPLLLSGCCLLLAPFKAEFEKALEEGLAKAFVELEDTVSLGLSALTFAMLEDRWPETREELQRGAWALESSDFGLKTQVDLTRFQDIALEQEPDGTLYIIWRKTGPGPMPLRYATLPPLTELWQQFQALDAYDSDSALHQTAPR